MTTKKNDKPIDACCGQVRPKGGLVLGAALLILGLFLILENYLAMDLMRYFWPIMLLLAGISLIYRSFNRWE